MPVYMDRHYIEGALDTPSQMRTRRTGASDRYQVKFLTYWFDEMRSTAFCLVEAPNRQAIEHAHDEAHGSIPNEVLEVDPAVVDAFRAGSRIRRQRLQQNQKRFLSIRGSAPSCSRI